MCNSRDDWNREGVIESAPLSNCIYPAPDVDELAGVALAVVAQEDGPAGAQHSYL